MTLSHCISNWQLWLQKNAIPHIGTVLLVFLWTYTQHSRQLFQFLIGTVLRSRSSSDSWCTRKFQFLIGTVLQDLNGLQNWNVSNVSIPYRYGITTVFSPFSGTVFFFSPQISLKSLSTSHFYYRKFPWKIKLFSKIYFFF